MIPSSTHMSCNYHYSPVAQHKHKHNTSNAASSSNNTFLKFVSSSSSSSSSCNNSNTALVISTSSPLLLSLKKSGSGAGVCRSSNNSSSTTSGGGGATSSESDNNKDKLKNPNPNNNKRDWSTSILLFFLWAALIFYVFMLSPNQTPSRDIYFLEKLLNLKGNDGFEMNPLLVSLWYIMAFWPLLYTMLLLPTARSSNSKIPVWPFLLLSVFAGAYALLPYFVLWKPPPPSLRDAELATWPLNVLESKLTSGILIAAGLGIITYAGLANADAWKEFYQYFRESKFIHVTCLDFALLSTFAPFWVYNDMTARKWSDKGSWVLPLTLFPFLGPAFYLFLRPPLSASSTTNKGG